MALADWDARLLSPERALALAGDWPVYAAYELAELSQFGDSQADRWQVNLRCRKCGQSCGLLGIGHGPLGADLDHSYQTNIGDLLSGVLRHLVTAHDLSLSGATSG